MMKVNFRFLEDAMSNSVDAKLRFLIRHFYFKENELGAIRSFYSGLPFSGNDPAFQRLLRLSAELCQQYRSLFEELPNPCPFPRLIQNYFQKRKILRLLFPGAKVSILAGPGLQLVLGAVDVANVAYFNNDVVFHPSALVSLGERVRFGPAIEVGDPSFEQVGEQIRARRITFAQDCWIGYGAKIADGVSLASGTVLAAGAYLNQDTKANAIMVSRPAIEKRIIIEGDTASSREQIPYSSLEKKQLHDLLIRLGFRRSWGVYERYLSGERVNLCGRSLSRLFLYSHRLCREYSQESTSAERKEEIKKILFPLQGDHFVLSEGFWLDMLGTVRVGSNVSIGPGAYLSGNLLLGDNVVLGNGVTLFASGHPLSAQERRFHFSFHEGFCEPGHLYSIRIRSGIHLGDHAVVAPSSEVKEDVPDNALYEPKGLLK